MALQVIGAGLGRTGTLSLKLALEHLGLGPCYHAMEIAATVRNSLPLWNDAIRGHADWERIFEGYQATVDYPGCLFWRELMVHYPQAKIILSVRDPDSWFESVNETIFPEERNGTLLGESGAALSDFLRKDFGGQIANRAFMVDYFNSWNRSVMAEVPGDRLLVFSPRDGWGPLCEFLHVPCPDLPFPWVHAREKKKKKLWKRRRQAPMPAHRPDELETMFRGYLDELSQDAFR